MKRIIIIFVTMTLLIMVNASCTKSTESGSPDNDKEITLETIKQKGSYIMGYNQGLNLKKRQVADELDLDIYMQGVKDAVKGTPKIEEEDRKELFKEFYKEFREHLDAKRKVIGEKNKVEGEKFLKENAAKEGIIITESGLQYKVLREGTGPQPKVTDTVKVNYTGTLIDGTEIESTLKRTGKPATFRLDHVILAWREGIQLMKVGAKYRFFAPSKLAYGERGSGQAIGPHAVLIFDIELLGFEPPEEEKKETKPAPGKK
ncbi:MAG: FKBP-type peptidyl-prolyl cis-trans isomerase [Candidatus Aminicenantes bacterium]|nr:MAG: FKBP-type peptidyl-prolyl cis-trans isomerase [Candidatus Aminicenantes bacterium]